MHEEKLVRGTTTVVYLEADRTNALLMQWLLGSRDNYALQHAVDGRSGLELCKSVKPDLVITEMHLPDMTAYGVLKGLRDDDSTQNLPCVVLSGDAVPAHIDRALAAGFDGYWTKPIDIWQLLKKINDAVSSAQWSFHRQRNASITE